MTVNEHENHIKISSHHPSKISSSLVRCHPVSLILSRPEIYPRGLGLLTFPLLHFGLFAFEIEVEGDTGHDEEAACSPGEWLLNEDDDDNDDDDKWIVPGAYREGGGWDRQGR